MTNDLCNLLIGKFLLSHHVVQWPCPKTSIYSLYGIYFRSEDGPCRPYLFHRRYRLFQRSLNVLLILTWERYNIEINRNKIAKLLGVLGSESGSIIIYLIFFCFSTFVQRAHYCYMKRNNTLILYKFLIKRLLSISHREFLFIFRKKMLRFFNYKIFTFIVKIVL